MEDGGWLNKYNDGGPMQENYNDASASMPPGFSGLGYNIKGRNYSPAWGGQFQSGGFLQPTSYKLPTNAYKGELSSELATSIGGVGDEPAYLIPTFKYGKPLKDPEAEYRKTGEHLGGPFKTYQEAEKFGEMRHQYVEQGRNIPSPLKWWGDDMAMGGSVPGSVGFTYARTQDPAPSNGPYAKKTLASAQDGIQKAKANTDEATKFLKDWYTKRKEIPEHKWVSEENLKNLDNVKIKNISTEELNKEKAGAFYDPSTRQISINPNDEFSSSVPTLVHEISHHLRSNFRSGKEREILEKSIDPTASFLHKSNDVGHGQEYMSKQAPEELHSRLNEFRYNFKLDPTKKYTEEEAKAFMTTPEANEKETLQDYKKRLDEYSEKWDRSEELFNLIKEDPKKLAGLLNGIAANKSTTPLTQAQNGKEMKFYQEGLDWKPKSISKNGKVIKDDRGQWAHPGEITEIGSNDITMQGVDYPVLGVSDTGDTKMMQPGKDYKFKGKKVTEYPMAQDGKKFSMKDVKKNATSKKYPSAQEMSGGPFQEMDKSLIKSADVITDLMQLGNFVPHPMGQSIGKAGNIIGGWLDAYQAADALDKGNYGDAAINLASVALPMALGSNTFKRNSKYLQKGQPLNFLKGKERVNYIEPFTNVKGMTNKSLMANRALLGTLGAETVYDSKKNGGWLNKYK
jgi:hypothetical protein